MAYTKNEDGSITLDTGEQVELSIYHERLPNGFVVYKVAAGSGPVVVQYHHTSETLDDELARQLLLLVLGEETSLGLPEDVKRSLSIRHHLAIETADQPDHTSLL